MRMMIGLAFAIGIGAMVIGHLMHLMATIQETLHAAGL